MSNDTKPRPDGWFSELVCYTLEEFCAEIIENFRNDRDRIDKDPALIELAATAIFWIVCDHEYKEYSIETITRSLKDKASAMVDRDEAESEALDRQQKLH